VLVEHGPARVDGVAVDTGAAAAARGEVDGAGERKPVVLGRTPDLGLELAQRVVDPPPERLVTLADADADAPLAMPSPRDGDDAIRAGKFVTLR